MLSKTESKSIEPYVKNYKTQVNIWNLIKSERETLKVIYMFKKNIDVYKENLV